MKKIFFILGLFVSIFFFGCTTGYVASKPPDQRYARPVSPGSGYIWTTGEWRYARGSYHWEEGSWQKNRKGQKWKSGYWETNKKGYRWHKGAWQ